LENVEYFNYLGSLVTNDARCTREIKSRIAMLKGAFNKKALFTSKLDLNLRKIQENFYIWIIASYRAETWIFRTVDQKHLKISNVVLEEVGEDWLDRLREKG
jgi:hypothetical protein